MGVYRINRNIEASFIDYIIDALEDAGWTNINVIKGFSRAYELSLPVIAVRTNTTAFDKLEIGSDDLLRNAQIVIDIFGSDDGNRLDLADFLVSIFKAGLPYYEYEVENGEISEKDQNGRIRVLSINSESVEFDTPKSTLDPKDRYRHLITLSISLGRGE